MLSLRSCRPSDEPACRLPVRCAAMTSRRMGSFAILAVGLFLSASTAWAHKPIFADAAARDAEHAVPVRDVDLSMVAYPPATHQSPQVWLAFDGK